MYSPLDKANQTKVKVIDRNISQRASLSKQAKEKLVIRITVCLQACRTSVKIGLGSSPGFDALTNRTMKLRPHMIGGTLR
jgi:hypothetical protein